MKKLLLFVVIIIIAGIGFYMINSRTSLLTSIVPATTSMPKIATQAEYLFNETGGTTAADASGFGQTGTLTNGPTFVAGKEGNAIKFDGNNDIVRVTRTPNLETPAVSISAWVKRDGSQQKWATILTKTWKNDSSPTYNSYALYLNPSNEGSGRIAFETGHNGSHKNLRSSSGAVPNNVWTHIVATYDPAAPSPQKKIYVNGVLVKSETVNAALAYDTTSTGDLYIGKNPASGQAYKGLVDNVAVYNKALTAEEVKSLFSGTPTTPPPATPTIKVETPNGGETFAAGTNLPVRVSYTNGQNSKISQHLYSPTLGNVGGYTTTFGPVNDGATGGEINLGSNLPAGQYRITACFDSVMDPQNGEKNLCDTSNAFFTITSTSTTTPPSNTAPKVNAGSDQSIAFGTKANLSGVVTDDGLPVPPGAVTTTWAKVSGPGTVTFENANSKTTSATFSVAGTYILALNASDGGIKVADEVTVTVNATTPPPPPSTGDKYVAPNGSDTNDGSSAAPWKTLAKAASGVLPGQTVIVRAGTYTGFQTSKDGTANARITFKADPSVFITSAGNGKDGINLEGADYWTIDGFTVNNMPRAGVRSVTNNGVIIRNVSADSNQYWGIFTGFSENVIIENNRTSNSKQEHGIYVSNGGDNPTVRNNVMFNNYSAGVQINADVNIPGSDGIITGALVEGNVMYGNGKGIRSATINLDGVQMSTVRNNLIFGNTNRNGIALFKIDGAAPSSHNKVVNNTVIVTQGAAMHVQNGSVGNMVTNNILLGNSWDISGDSWVNSNYNILTSKLTGEDGNSITGQNASMLFENAAGGVYKLKTGSAAINAGSCTSLAPKDIDGVARPQGGACDIGAYESF